MSHELASPAWPELHYAESRETYSALHLWTQVVGKIRLATTPWLNHSWHVALYVDARGLTTSPMPYDARSFELRFDFLEHVLECVVTDGRSASVPLMPQSVAHFKTAVMAMLADLDIQVSIRDQPCEIEDAIPFSADRAQRDYDRDAAERLWRALCQADRVFKQFRTSFLGKCSPVHFFWGGFDLAVTRFSGRRAPLHPRKAPGMAAIVMQEAYSHEVCSAGFWPGAPGIDPSFYAYAYPEPAAFRAASVMPASARYDDTLGEFLLPYEAVRSAENPDLELLAFLQSTYDAAADAAQWDRAALEQPPGRIGVCRLP
jgi:hypothetical protein